uniref:AIPP2-like SPOC-like domain-containing protein n=1 Tax=Solanum lycopersicum TaxID=4081 RepID=A0A3Q7GX49_SOLLC
MEPNNIHQAHMEKICGDIGSQEAIITCYKCKNVDVHQYCVSGYYVDAPVYWCCEKCDNDKWIISVSHGLENVQSEGSSAKLCPSSVHSNEFPRGSRNRINWEKEVKTGKARYLPVKDGHGLQSGMEKYESPLGTSLPSRVVSTESMAIVTQDHFSNPRVQISNSFPKKSAMQLVGGAAGSTIMKQRSPNSSTTHPYDPALVPSWKGNFDILGELELAPGYIQAHSPCRVRRKVYEFSGRLPDTLKLELVPRGDIWASLFNGYIPDKEDIGLYFFASERERSDRYIALVEFMHSKDLVLRTLINDVELIILTSTALCSDSQSWNSEHFLWGLFYRMGQDTDGCAEGGSNKVVDMEIDMIAGEDVGTLDIVLHSWS